MPIPWPSEHGVPVVKYRYRIVPGGEVKDGTKDEAERIPMIPNSKGEMPADGNLYPMANVMLLNERGEWVACNTLARKVMNPRLPVFPYGLHREKGFGWELIRSSAEGSYAGFSVVMQLKRAQKQGKVAFYGWDKPGEWYSEADTEQIRQKIAMLKPIKEQTFVPVSQNEMQIATSEAIAAGEMVEEVS